MTEPILTNEDRRIWAQLERTALVYSKTEKHQRRVKRAQAEILRAVDKVQGDLWSAWSAGKDSTAMVHLIAMLELDIPAMSIKDDLDYPGEEEYLRELAQAWNVRLEIMHPPFSLQEWIQEHAHAMLPGDDIHSRSAALSQDAFYSLIEEFRVERGVDGVFLGLRKHESKGRLLNFKRRGRLYLKADGEWVCQPLADWEGLDVYAYLVSRGIPLLPVYHCVRFADRAEDVRKSWWFPGTPGKSPIKGATWLKSYYPSLYQRMIEIFPQGGSLA